MDTILRVFCEFYIFPRGLYTCGCVPHASLHIIRLNDFLRRLSWLLPLSLAAAVCSFNFFLLTNCFPVSAAP